MKYTNTNNIHISLAVFLASDFYDADTRDNAISATTLIKPIRQIILCNRVRNLIEKGELTFTQDISEMIASSIGTAIHDGIEKAWKKNYRNALALLGYPKNIIDRIIINPTDDISENAIPVYVENRLEKQIDNYFVVGKYDMIVGGQIIDHKSTGVFTYMQQSKTDDFILQGSIYRWLNPKKVTDDSMVINFIFTDWSALRAKIEANKGYPNLKVMSKEYPLLSLQETERYICSKLDDLTEYINADEKDIPFCSEESLMADPTIYKYYKNPENKKRSSGNFDSYAEAMDKLIANHGVGEVVVVKGKVRKCNYCMAKSICSQYQQLKENGLVIERN